MIEVVKTLRPQDIVVELDNGHGTRIYTKGKCSSDGRYYEGEWSRMMVQKLAMALREIGFDARIIVPEQTDILLHERCRRANAIMAANPGKQHLYVSIHTNADAEGNLVNGWSKASGLCVYCSTRASKASKIIARNVYDAGAEIGLAGNRCVPPAHYWQAGFTVITDTRMPAILTESAFHTNRKDVDFLLSERGQEAVINYHILGICRSFGIPCPVKIGKP